MDVEKALRIALINLHSSQNAGDDALVLEAVRQLRGQFPEASFVLVMNDPNSYTGDATAVGSWTQWVKSSRRDGLDSWRWYALPALALYSLLAVTSYRLSGKAWTPGLSAERRALVDAYLQADLVVSCAGNFLYSSGRIGLSLLLALYAILYAWLAGKPLYTLPQTLGPFGRWRDEVLVRWVLSKARLVMVRDPISEQVWKKWALADTPGLLVPDLAFAFDSAYDANVGRALLAECGIDCAPGDTLLGVTLVDWGAQQRRFVTQERYEAAVEAAIRSFVEASGGRAVLFAQVCGPGSAQDDRVPARRLRSRLADLGDRVVLIDRRLPAATLKSAYGCMSLFLGTRLHSNLFALAEGVPVVAVGYQYKTRGVMRMLGLERWTIDIEDAHAEPLSNLVLRAWAERTQTREQIRDVLPGLRARAAQAAAWVADDFRSLMGQT